MSLEQIFSEVFLTPVAPLEDDVLLSDYAAWDSMTHIFLVERIESLYSIQLSGDEIADIQSVGNIRQLIEKHKGRNESN